MQIRRKLAIVVETVVTSLLYGLFAYYIIYERLAFGHPVIAYIMNLLFIIVILMLDIWVHRKMDRKEFLAADRSKLHDFLGKMLFYCHFVSFKTGLYLFYLIMLIASRTSTLEPSLLDPYMRTFIYSVEYGILLLLPMDKFLEQLYKDDKRMQSILERIKNKQKPL